MTTFTDFLLWEQSTRDIIDFKKVYVDMAGDVLAGLVLSEIVYWHLPKRDGESKLRVHKDGQDWIACRRVEWWDRTRMTPRQIDRVFNVLVKKGLIVKDLFHFAGKPTVHIRLVQEAFLKAWEAMTVNPPANPYANLPKREIREENTLINEMVKSNLPNGDSQFTASVNSYTETTASTTKQKKIRPPKAKPLSPLQEWRNRLAPVEGLVSVLLATFEQGYDPAFSKPVEFMTVTLMEKYVPVAEELEFLRMSPEQFLAMHREIKSLYDRKDWSVGLKTIREKAPSFMLRAKKTEIQPKRDTQPIPIFTEPTDEEREELERARREIRPIWEAVS